MTTRFIFTATLAVLIASAGCGIPGRDEVCRTAREAVKALPEVPDDAALCPREEMEIYMGKNASYVIIPGVPLEGPAETYNSYTVHLKRVARRWEVERCFPTPDYPAQ
ncbi:MAG: hypothetical protein R6V03_04070 [Kiritimatiellia bacterium]